MLRSLTILLTNFVLITLGAAKYQFPSAINRFAPQLPKKLPDKLIIAYANWNECDEKIVEAAVNGANVIMWFSINLLTDPSSGNPIITNGPNWDCVANITRTIRDVYKLPTVHMISVGGWNSPHPSTKNSPEEVYSHWKHWNEQVIARPQLGFHGFDGIDWDIEGLRNTY